MKTLIQFSLIFLMVGLLASCKSDAKKANANSAAKPATSSSSAETYKIDPGAKMTWIGSKLTGKHNGEISINNGAFKVVNNKLTGGIFSIDMASINCKDLDASSGKGKLEGHLKSPDFFDVAKFPTATFEITKVVEVKNNPKVTHNIYGNLTLKGVTKNINFLTKMAISKGSLIATVPNFKIDRTAFNVKYGSKKFFDNLKDKAIMDEIELGIPGLTAKK